jgi:transposase
MSVDPGLGVFQIAPPARDPADQGQCRRHPAAATLVSAAAPPGELVGDKGYGANHLRCFLAERGTVAVIPSTSSRKVPIPHSAERYKLRSVIERTFCRLKGFRDIATRYDETIQNSLAAVCLVSAITYWA